VVSFYRKSFLEAPRQPVSQGGQRERGKDHSLLVPLAKKLGKKKLSEAAREAARARWGKE
jgi:hypothetical protein